jgi:hypothetical protein
MSHAKALRRKEIYAEGLFSLATGYCLLTTARNKKAHSSSVEDERAVFSFRGTTSIYWPLPANTLLPQQSSGLRCNGLARAGLISSTEDFFGR